jgi:hypothetical protein
VRQLAGARYRWPMVNRNHRRSGRFTPKGPNIRSRDRDLPEVPLVRDAQQAVSEDSPFTLLALASQLIEVTTARPSQHWQEAQGQANHPFPQGDDLFDSFVACGIPAMSALAKAIGTLHHDRRVGDRLLRSINTSLLTGFHPWVHQLADITVTDISVQKHVLGDGDNFIISWSWPDGNVGSMVVYIDHNMGTVLKDAFPLPETHTTLLQTFDHINATDDMTTTSITAAHAKACISEGLALGQITVPPFESDTWPMCRPWLEWLLRHLPDGGEGFTRQQWADDELAELVQRFTTSPFRPSTADLSDSDLRELVGPLLIFAMSTGSGDPLRWSPVTIEILLVDWYVRKVIGVRPELLQKLPVTLRSFVQFAHHERHIPGSLTIDTLDAIVHWQADFRRSVKSLESKTSPRSRASRPPLDTSQPTMPGIMRMGDGFPLADTPTSVSDDDFIREAANKLERNLIKMVGGQRAYDTITADPLPDVPFDWNGIHQTLHDDITATLIPLDQWAVTCFDAEVRTIARSVLRTLAITDPSILNRSAKPESLAAAILGYLLQWITQGIPKAERAALWPITTTKALAEVTGVSASSIGSRSTTVRHVIEDSVFDRPNLFHSCQRRDVLRSKELIAEWRSSRLT